MKIAIMGGTFNPIHYAHLLSAEEVRDGLGYDKILFIPSARPPHKDARDIIAPEHRYQMTLLATSDNSDFEVSRIELDRVGPSLRFRPSKSYKPSTARNVISRLLSVPIHSSTSRSGRIMMRFSTSVVLSLLRGPTTAWTKFPRISETVSNTFQ